MTTLIEEMKLAVLQIWQSLGFERSAKTAAAVVPALVLGIALNVAALSVVNNWRTDCHKNGEKAALEGAARVEVKAVNVVVVSTLKRIGDGQRRLCLARQWVHDRHEKAVRYYSEMRCGWGAHKGVTVCIKMELLKRFSHCQRGVQNAA